MQCDKESLQMYLDGEMDGQARKITEAHLSKCRTCRREIGHLQFLWLELGQTHEVELPPELPYLRQQIIHQAMSDSEDQHRTEGSYWDLQRLAWQPAMVGVSYLPGVSLLVTASRAAGHQIPRLLSASISIARKLVFRPQAKKERRSLFWP